jgi:hypothetical protein
MPIGRLPLQHFCRENSIACCVLHVDVEIRAGHLHYDVHVYLHVVPDPFLDREGVILVATPPARELGCYEEEGYYEHSYGPFSSACCSGHILGF